MVRGPCKFFNSPQGCNRGESCVFQHQTAGSSSTGLTSPTRSRISAPGDRPPGACDFFWKNGSCKREFDCRYRHVQSDTPSQTDSSRSPYRSTLAPVPTTLLSLLGPTGLAKINGLSTDVFFPSTLSPLSPTQIHNLLKRFLYEDYRFRKTTDVYAFLSLLAHANPTSNTTWVRFPLQYGNNWYL